MTSFEKTETSETKTTTTNDSKIEKPNTEITSRVKNDPDLWREAAVLADMLSFCRPHSSKSERKFIAKYLIPLKGFTFDKKGNLYKRIGENPTVLWSCHTDTVHNTSGTQKIQYWPSVNGKEVFFESTGLNANCLGADDTAGVWLMTEMIKANVPGLYIFHRGEEVGCIGSKWIAEKRPEALAGIKFAIALDRKGENSIITYQCSERCCSDEFANSLSEQLGMGHKGDNTGLTTDTRSYVDLIPECTNLSVGYYNAHGRGEYLNVDYLFRLRDALCKIDVTKFVEKRKAGDKESLYSNRWTWKGGSYYESYSYSARSPNSHWKSNIKKKRDIKDGFTGYELRKSDKYKDNPNWCDDYEWDSGTSLWYPKDKMPKDDFGATSRLTHTDAVRMVRQNPEAIVDLLNDYGIDAIKIKEFLMTTGLDGQGVILL